MIVRKDLTKGYICGVLVSEERYNEKGGRTKNKMARDEFLNTGKEVLYHQY